LYNQAADESAIAEVIAAAVASFDPGLAVLCLPGSAMAAAAGEAGLHAVAEGYLDRAYDERGRLVPRSRPGAVITDGDAVVARAVALATHVRVRSIEGNDVDVDVRSLCTHGDTPAALDLARSARRALEDEGIAVRAFVD
nr:LamB/YcsF family protein [Actinomycetota bacterium]